MVLAMEFSYPLLIVCLLWVSIVPGVHPLQSSQTQVLQQLRKHLEYPQPLDIWDNYSGDICNLESSPQVSLVCEEDTVVELKIMGVLPSSKVSKFDGFPISNQTLSSGFSIDSFFTTLSRLNNLRVLSLVALGIWGPLPDKIHRLDSLELLDLCGNFLYGSIPPKISEMVKLQVLTLDGNFFNDTIPNWFDSLSNLMVLSLKNNQLKGPFPSSICRIKSLTDLSLSHNNISGGLPDLSSLTNLHVLDLRENQIDSVLSAMPQGLVNVLLSRNSFKGEIPQQFGKLNQLQHLDLSANFLRGTPPPSLFSLPNISFLNLGSNRLSGSLPYRLSCGGVLGYVDISNNRLTGGLPSCLRVTSDKRVMRVGGNCLSVDPKHQHPESYCRNVDIEKKETALRGRNLGVLVGVVIGIVVFMALLAFGFIFLCRRYCKRASEQHLLPKAVQENSITGFSSEILASARFISQAAKLGNQGVPTYRLFAIEELKEATNNFDESTYLGEGSIGKLYKGKLENDTFVAIRCLALFKRDSIRNLKLRLDLLSKLRHPHLVCLLGHCIDGGDDSSVNRVYLIYEYVPKGNLYMHLSDDGSEEILKWSERLAVLIGIAKAVHFLHTGIIPGFLNNRLKANNILLDEHGVAKLSDYGLSIITKEIDKFEVKKDGNKSWQMAKLDDDVYSFGFILLEMLVGPTKAGTGETFLLNEMTSFGSQDGRRRIVDPVVLSTCSQESLSIVISITNKCISHDSSTRPSFEDVLWNLQYAAQVHADGDQRSDVSAQP